MVIISATISVAFKEDSGLVNTVDYTIGGNIFHGITQPGKGCVKVVYSDHISNDLAFFQ
jgi:hypothetical protein